MIKRGEIYWLSSGAARGREQAGRRPALIIQNDRGNESSNTTIGALMTSRVSPRLYPMHVVVSAGESGLGQRSTILLEQIQTVDVQRLGQRIGLLDPTTMEEVDKALHRSLGIMFCPAAYGGRST